MQAQIACRQNDPLVCSKVFKIQTPPVFTQLSRGGAPRVAETSIKDIMNKTDQNFIIDVMMNRNRFYGSVVTSLA